MASKRKDFSPKKKERNTHVKRASIEQIDLTSCEDDVSNEIREKLSFEEERSTQVKIKEEVEVDDYDCYRYKQTAYVRDDRRLPKYSESSPNLEEIFNICLLHNVPDEKIVKVKPTRIKETVTFVVQPDLINLRHPYDLEADDTPGAFIKRDQVRFYEAKSTAEGELVLSSEVRVTRNKKGQVVRGTYNRRKNGVLKAKTAKLRKLYAVVRKRAVHKNTLESFATAFTRYVIFVMTLEEYNEVHGNLANLKEYKLSSNMMITHYYFDTGHAVPIVPAKHGNAKSQDSPDFRPTEHSLKKECKQTVQVSNKAPRILAETLGQTDETILSSTTDSTRLRNPKQASNYKFNYGSVSRSDQDEISNVILALLEQNHDSDSVVLDDNQPFIREVIFRHGRQPSIVAFTDQTIKDVSRFCTRSGNLTHFSPLLIDTTFNIAEYYFTQTAYENLSLRKKDTGKHPWFPGPILVHRNKTTEDFKYFWQSVKRENCQLEGLHVLGSDED